MRLRDIVRDIAYKTHSVGDLLATNNNPNYWYKLVKKNGFFGLKAVEKHSGKMYSHMQEINEPTAFRAVRPEEMN